MNEQTTSLVNQAKALFAQLAQLDDNERMDAINEIRQALHKQSPMRDNPVDCVLWVKQEEVHANPYNPNRVAPPEMALLKKSIEEDGMTQPIVGWREKDNGIEIVDGFHRSEVARSSTIQVRLQGRLPVAIINQDRTDLVNRMAATVRHDRTKGSPNTELMQKIVADLIQSGMSERWIMQHFGMDADELLRLKQLTGLAALFNNAEFSRSWIAEDELETQR